MTAVLPTRPERPTGGRLVDQFEYGLDAPICLTWELTYACNLACVSGDLGLGHGPIILRSPRPPYADGPVAGAALPVALGATSVVRVLP